MFFHFHFILLFKTCDPHLSWDLQDIFSPRSVWPFQSCSINRILENEPLRKSKENFMASSIWLGYSKVELKVGNGGTGKALKRGET